MFLKLMSDEDLPDNDSRKSYTLIERVEEVRFARDAGGAPFVEYIDTHGARMDRALYGNAYVYNDIGHVIDAFGIASPYATAGEDQPDPEPSGGPIPGETSPVCDGLGESGEYLDPITRESAPANEFPCPMTDFVDSVVSAEERSVGHNRVPPPYENVREMETFSNVKVQVDDFVRFCMAWAYGTVNEINGRIELRHPFLSIVYVLGFDLEEAAEHVRAMCLGPLRRSS